MVPVHPPSLTWWRSGVPGRRRLHGEIVAFRGELLARADEPTVRKQSWWRETTDLLEVAGEIAAGGPVSAGFEALNAARRVIIADYSEEEVYAEATALREEAKTSKLRGWRGQAIEGILKRLDAEPRLSSSGQKARLRTALRIRDEGTQNTHRRNGVIASRYFQLLLVALVAVSLIVLLSWQEPLVDLLATEETSDEWPIWLYAFLFGVIGASISASLSLSRIRKADRVPEVWAGTMSAVFRPVFGGSAAIGAFALLSAGLLLNLEPTAEAVAAIAFLAGFSDRLIDAVAGRFAT